MTLKEGISEYDFEVDEDMALFSNRYIPYTVEKTLITKRMMGCSTAFPDEDVPYQISVATYQ